MSRVRIVGGGANGGGTGARVAHHKEEVLEAVECAATTLDDLFTEKIPVDARCLCKLDLERHELLALAGATRILSTVEVVLTEVQFYDINDAGKAIFADMVAFLQKHEFQLYDFACLGSSPPRHETSNGGRGIRSQRQPSIDR